MATALSIVQRIYPEVTTISDAKKECVIEVTKRDTASAAVRNHRACAMAVACKRKLEADGVIISVNTAYVIKGNKAYRYRVPTSVAREVVSFDRNGGFDVGEYRLTAPSPGTRLGARAQRKGAGHGGDVYEKGAVLKKFKHRTGNIRASLGSKDVV